MKEPFALFGRRNLELRREDEMEGPPAGLEKFEKRNLCFLGGGDGAWGRRIKGRVEDQLSLRKNPTHFCWSSERTRWRYVHRVPRICSSSPQSWGGHDHTVGLGWGELAATSCLLFAYWCLLRDCRSRAMFNKHQRKKLLTKTTNKSHYKHPTCKLLWREWKPRHNAVW